jgi:hypothetical protein
VRRGALGSRDEEDDAVGRSGERVDEQLEARRQPSCEVPCEVAQLVARLKRT